MSLLGQCTRCFEGVLQATGITKQMLRSDREGKTWGEHAEHHYVSPALVLERVRALVASGPDCYRYTGLPTQAYRLFAS